MTQANLVTDAFEAAILRSEAKQVVDDSFVIVNYSEKALAIFGDTRPMKDQLKAMGGRFNPKLSYEGGKRAGWIFSKSKEQEVKSLLTIK
jgi:uncharacterized iron-regulated protein